jgi:hypothetical protein
MNRCAMTTLLASSLLFAAPAFAQDDAAPAAEAEDLGAENDDAGDATDEEAPAEEAPADADAGEPSGLPDADVVILAGDERLSGKLIQIKDGNLILESATLGKQTIPLEKVVEFKTASAHDVVFANGDKVTGTIVLDADGVTVTPPAGEADRRERSALTGVNPDPEKTELDYWSALATVGANMTFGNTRSRSAAWLMSVARDDGFTRFWLQYTGAYGADRGVEDTKNHRGDGKFDIYITDRFYATPAVGHVLYDKFSNIDLRWRYGLGAGYYLFKEEKINWNVEGAFSYGVTDFRSVQAGERDKRYETFCRVGTNLTYTRIDGLTFAVAHETYIGTKNIKDSTHRTIGSIGYVIIDGVSVSLTAIYDRMENPVRDADGDLPKRDDLSLILGLSVGLGG